MKSANIVQDKSFQFAIRIILLYKYLIEEHREFVLSKQVLKSGTSIGANVEESLGAQSKRDFLNKMSIAYKEARETLYWLKLLHATDYITQDQFSSVEKDLEELLKLIGSIQKTTKANLKL
ncbi:four helix bundle protein [candidate division KSB1 bacterium]|nr:four helix bundle protein [candidate division KSB1 bacterium]